MWCVCWCKFGRNPTKSFWVTCILVIMSLVPRQSYFLDFACLSIYIFDTSPELFVCLSIYENAETLSPVPVQKKGWKIDPHVSNLIITRERKLHSELVVFFSFFLSLVLKTQPNRWTKQMVITQLNTSFQRGSGPPLKNQLEGEVQGLPIRYCARNCPYTPTTPTAQSPIIARFPYKFVPRMALQFFFPAYFTK